MAEKLALKKFLMGHLAHCKMWEFHLGEERYCSCGKVAAEQELERVKKVLLQVEYCVDNDLDMVCPLCAKPSGLPHTDDCELGYFLKGLQ